MTTYSAADVIQLPRLQSSGAMALGEQLISVAKLNKKALSKSLASSLALLDARHVSLSNAIRDQVVPEPQSGVDTVQLDRNLDSCWSGLNDFLTAFTKIPGASKAVEAALLQAAILPGGLKFVLLPYELEWAESETRIQRMSKHKLTSRVEALGGGIFIEALTKAHIAYGKALGMTAPLTPGPTPPSIRGALDGFTAALRTYIIKVMGHVEEDEPETEVLAEKLLAPLAAWEVVPPPKSGAPSMRPGAMMANPVPTGSGV
jgi:hypothetical protein